LDFDTIPQRSGHGWDIVLIAGRAVHPYFIVVECKTAAEGTYSYLVKKQDYLYTLKSYCLDLFKDKLIGAYKGYAKYMLLVAPDFPGETEGCCEMPELVIPERRGIVDYINIEHDYYEIWERILKRLGKEFVNILKETSFSQVKNTELKEDLLKMLKVK